MPKASQKFTNSAAFSQPSAVRTASSFSATLPSSSQISERLATAPTVTPSRRKKPVTMFLAYPAFTSKKLLSSARMDRATDVSPTQPAISGFTRFRSSVQSSKKLASSSLLAGRKLTSSLTFSRMVASSATTSTIPLSSAWNLAEEESHLVITLPPRALGAFTNSLAFFSSMKVKSVMVGNSPKPPPQVPNTAVI